MDQAAITAAAKKLYTPPAKRVSQGTKLVRPPRAGRRAIRISSIWSQADNLTDVDTTHWTGGASADSLVALTARRIGVMGVQPGHRAGAAAESLTVTPTRASTPLKASRGVDVDVYDTGVADDIDLLSRPVTYVSYDSVNRRLSIR